MGNVPSDRVSEALHNCQFLSVGEVLGLLKVSKSTLHGLTFRKNNPVPSVKIGKSRRYPFDKVRWWMENLAR